MNSRLLAIADSFGEGIGKVREIRGLLNAGHRKGTVAGRCVVRGKEVFTEELPAYCAVAMAGLGYLPDTILIRSVVVNMRRRAPNETIEPYRRRLEVEKGDHLRNRLAVWASNATDQVRDAWPDMPEGIADRNADVWEALFSVAVPLAESGPIGACSGCSTCSTHPEG